METATPAATLFGLPMSIVGLLIAIFVLIKHKAQGIACISNKLKAVHGCVFATNTIYSRV